MELQARSSNPSFAEGCLPVFPQVANAAAFCSSKNKLKKKPYPPSAGDLSITPLPRAPSGAFACCATWHFLPVSVVFSSSTATMNGIQLFDGRKSSSPCLVFNYCLVSTMLLRLHCLGGKPSAEFPFWALSSDWLGNKRGQGLGLNSKPLFCITPCQSSSRMPLCMCIDGLVWLMVVGPFSSAMSCLDAGQDSGLAYHHANVGVFLFGLIALKGYGTIWSRK